MIPLALSIEMHIILSRHICLHKIQSKAHRTVGIFHVQNDSIRTVHPNATDVGRAMKIQSKAHRTVGIFQMNQEIIKTKGEKERVYMYYR